MYAVIEFFGLVVNTLWQAVLMGVLVKVILHFIPHIGAATRHAIWWVTLASVLLLPFESSLFSRARPHPQPLRSAHAQTVRSPIPDTMPDRVVLRVTPAPTALWPRMVLCTWIAILLWQIAQILRSYLYLGGVKRRARAAQIARSEIPRGATVLVSSEIASPIAAGFLPPSIVLAESMLPHLETADLEYILLHETAHLAKYDDWANLIQRLLGGALALHPVAIWILGQIERERELACDDWVVSRTGAARSYAESLVRLMDLRESRRDPALAVGVLGATSRLRRRIEMLLRPGRTYSGRASYLGALGSAAALSLLLFAGSFAPGWIALAQRPPIPEWQISAGGKMAFDVASVKPTTVFRPANFSMVAGISYKPTGGSLSAVRTLIGFIEFAYKLALAPDEVKALRAQLPKWAGTELFDIQARAPQSNPTRDQMRLMMQSLLAERFHLSVHFETQTMSVFEMKLVKPGKLGPGLRPFDDTKPCDAPRPAVPPSDENFLPPCYTYFRITTRSGPGTAWAGSRNSPVETLASAIQSLDDLGRPVVDRSGLTGNYDWKLEWTPERQSRPRANGDLPAQPEPAGPSYVEALKEQLGIRLEAAKAPTPVLIVDHIEKLSEN